MSASMSGCTAVERGEREFGTRKQPTAAPGERRFFLLAEILEQERRISLDQAYFSGYNIV